MHTDKMLDLMSDWIGDLTSARVLDVLSAVLHLPEKDVRGRYRRANSRRGGTFMGLPSMRMAITSLRPVM
ncbi:hypothetical protein BZM27_06280 [Paraburkholderia steynii]|uniref:Uncharacterized protein n=1 Tax=Paraburkholderia steynii TaxID=1245441 RepID=A0A4R0XM71_9BURK|nr:hypothetical protein BZM27_06280 [Paraburkholderia steynii]